MILISRNMDDVVAVADRIVIIKASRKIAESAIAGHSARSLGQAILSGEIDQQSPTLH